MSKLQDEQHMSESILESEKSSIKNQKLLNKKRKWKKEANNNKKIGENEDSPKSSKSVEFSNAKKNQKKDLDSKNVKEKIKIEKNSKNEKHVDEKKEKTNKNNKRKPKEKSDITGKEKLDRIFIKNTSGLNLENQMAVESEIKKNQKRSKIKKI